MQVCDIEVKNVLPILTDLVEVIRNFNDSNSIYLCPTCDNGTHEPGIIKKAFGLNEAKLPEFLNKLGVRSLTLSSPYPSNSLLGYFFDIDQRDNNGNRWSEIKSEKLVYDLSKLFMDCRTIAFDDWANVADCSDLWSGLLSDVIRPLQKKDLDFIFFLGDPAKKVFYEVDEILDIISEFSEHGRVTFCLDESEAVDLWMVLNGEHPDATLRLFTEGDLKRKYFSIFRTMAVDQLLIYSVNEALLYSEVQQFILKRKVVDRNIQVAKDARDKFIVGFTAGLIMQLDIKYCIALGLIVFASPGRNKSNPDKDDLLSYTQQWIMDLNNDQGISLS